MYSDAIIGLEDKDMVVLWSPYTNRDCGKSTPVRALHGVNTIGSTRLSTRGQCINA